MVQPIGLFPRSSAGASPDWLCRGIAFSPIDGRTGSNDFQVFPVYFSANPLRNSGRNPKVFSAIPAKVEFRRHSDA